jgi:hypothetical protein
MVPNWVIALIDTVAGAGMLMVIAAKPQTLVNPATVEQALMFTGPPAAAEVTVTNPVLLTVTVVPKPAVATDQVTVWEGLLVPTTAADSCSVVVPVAGRLIVAALGVTFTAVTVAGLVLTVMVATPHTAVTTVEQACTATFPAPTVVSNPLALIVATEAGAADQVTVVATPASAFTAAVICWVDGCEMVMPLGATAML